MATAGGGRAEADGAGGARGLRKRRAGTGSTVADAATATTLFVRGVPPEATHGMLEKAFSAVGPVREAFLVDDKFAGRHRGIGFVKFALRRGRQSARSQRASPWAEGRGGRRGHKRGRIEEGKRRTLTPREEDPQAQAHKERRRERREERDAAAKARPPAAEGRRRAEADDEVDADAVAQRAGARRPDGRAHGGPGRAHARRAHRARGPASAALAAASASAWRARPTSAC